MSTTTIPYLTTHHLKHRITVAAPSADVFAILADAEQWPYVFGPTVHAQVEQLGPHRQRLHLWAFGAATVRHWTSLRTVDPNSLRITFHQERVAAPAASLGGEWILRSRPGGTTEVTLLHHFQAVDDDPPSVALIERAMDENSNAELASLKEAAEPGGRFADRVVSFCDAIDIDAPPAAVYDFLYRADYWPNRLPHVSRLHLAEPRPGVQQMTMDTRSPDGEVHTTESVRICRPELLEIAYKQTARPAIMSAHVGRWIVLPRDSGAQVVSHHTVVLDLDAVAELYGPEMTVDKAREGVRRILGGNSRATMEEARTFTQRRA